MEARKKGREGCFYCVRLFCFQDKPLLVSLLKLCSRQSVSILGSCTTVQQTVKVKSLNAVSHYSAVWKSHSPSSLRNVPCPLISIPITSRSTALIANKTTAERHCYASVSHSIYAQGRRANASGFINSKLKRLPPWSVSQLWLLQKPCCQKCLFSSPQSASYLPAALSVPLFANCALYCSSVWVCTLKFPFGCQNGLMETQCRH